jgi:hypothetical protein
MEAVGLKVAEIRNSVRAGEAVRAAGRWWLNGWLQFTTVVAGGPEYLAGPRPWLVEGQAADE